MATKARDALPWVLAALSGVAVFASFAPWEAASLAFVALIPWIWALRLRPDAAARLSFLAGLCAWIPSLWFLTPVTHAGALVLAVVCALYFVPVGLVWARVLREWTPMETNTSLLFVLAGAAWWCFWEWIRSWFLTGFPWNALGVSQYANLTLIQCARWGGVGAVSFVLVAMNIGLGLGFMGLFHRPPGGHGRRAHPEVYLPILLLVFAFSWGARHIRRSAGADANTLRIAVVQPHAAVDEKWSPESLRENYRVLWELSDSALRLKPDLLVWPETALPEELRASEEAVAFVTSLAARGTPLLLGSLDYSLTDTPGYLYYNASFLMLPDGSLGGQYWKRHLVMFGEYIPFGKWLPFLRSMTPVADDITPGTEPGLFPVPSLGMTLGILICFEDLMPHLSRDLVAGGARLLVNQTNDAWFDPYWGSQGHLANAVFRCVEQNRPMVRAANSGVSCWIDGKGAIRDTFRDPLHNHVRVRGTKPFLVEVPRDPGHTPYHKAPWAFPMLCAALSLLLWPIGRDPRSRG